MNGVATSRCILAKGPLSKDNVFRDLGTYSLLPSEYVISTLSSHPQERDGHESSNVTPKPLDGSLLGL